MITSELIEVLISISILITCISYMFMGCAGHRRRNGEESMAADSQATPEGEAESQRSQADGASPSNTGTPSQAGTEAATPQSSIAGYQSQTSEILAGPGEGLNTGASVTSRASSSRVSSSHGVHSKLQSSLSNATSRLGSTLSRATGSKFGSTLDSHLQSSRAASGHGGQNSVLSMMSRGGHSAMQSTLSRNQSNIQSSLSSHAGNRSSLQSAVPSKMAQSNLDSGWASRAKNSNIAQSILSATSNFGRSKASHINAPASNVSPPGSKFAGASSNLSRQVTSSLAVSGSSPISNVSNLTGSSAASGAGGGASSANSNFSARSVVTPQSIHSQQSAKGKGL